MSSTCRSEKSSGYAWSDNVAMGPHIFGFNANSKAINWERLEYIRLKKLRLGPERYSRHFQRFQRTDGQTEQQQQRKFNDLLTKQPTEYIITAYGEIRKANSIAPFATVYKPTCGFFFSRETDNKKKKIGIPPTNLVKWRSFVQ